MFSYYYSRLNGNARSIYNALDEAAVSFDKSVSFSGSLNQRDFEAAVYAFQYDCPEYFMLDFSNVKGAGGLISKKLYVGFKYSKEEYKRIKSEIDRVVAAIVNNTRRFNNDFDKVLFVHDYLATTVKYDFTMKGKNIFNAVGAIVDKVAVCQGIALATKLILDALDIDCIFMEGAVKSPSVNGPHGWNMVKINNRWYHLDVTLDLNQNNSTHFHTYFLLNDDDIKINHQVTRHVDIECKYINDNYFFRNKCFFKSPEEAGKYVAKKLETQNLVEIKLIGVSGQNVIKDLMKSIQTNMTRVIQFLYIPNEAYNVYAFYRK